MTDRAGQFDSKRPTVTEVDIAQASRADRVVMSWGGFPVITKPPEIGALALKFLLGTGATETIILDPYACEVLRLLLNDIHQSGWRATVSAPPEQTRH